jgi:hypothetical protein
MKTGLAGNIVTARFGHTAQAGRNPSRVICMRNRYDLSYLCGFCTWPDDVQGSIAAGLLSHAANVVRTDISPGMVEQFDTRMKHLGLPQHCIYATLKNLVRTTGDFAQKFGVVVINHLPDHNIS